MLLANSCLPLMRSNSILVIRHGHREEKSPKTFGNDMVLTPEGREASALLGSSIAELKIGEVHTSPILRCVQTAEEVLKGANQQIPLFLSKALGDPGPFVLDPARAGPIFLEMPLQQIMQSLVEGRKLPGMPSLAEGGRLFLDFISQVKQFPCLMISHDIIICLLCCFFFESTNIEKYMPYFLQGFLMTIDGSSVSIHCKNQTTVLQLPTEQHKI